MSVSPTRGAGFTAPHPRGAAVSVAPPHGAGFTDITGFTGFTSFEEPKPGDWTDTPVRLAAAASPRSYHPPVTSPPWLFLVCCTVPSATPPQSPSLTLATVPADEDIVAAMVEQNGFLRRDIRKSRRTTIAALDDAPHEVTALLAKIDEAQHASSGTLDEVHTGGPRWRR